VRVGGHGAGVTQRDGSMVDYYTLLTKYIAYIADCEGIDYIEPIDLRDE
jgi:hypothetical protein